jgi:hypothetical protein
LTAALTFTSIMFTWILAIPIGIYSAVKQYSLGDYFFTFVGFLADIEQPLTRRNLINLAHFLPKQPKDFDLHLVQTVNQVVNLILHEKADPVNPFEELEHPT